MNKSEILLSALSDKIFLKEMVIDELCYTPQDFSEVELADLIINLGDIIIPIQLKERNPKDMSSSLSLLKKDGFKEYVKMLRSKMSKQSRVYGKEVYQNLKIKEAEKSFSIQMQR